MGPRSVALFATCLVDLFYPQVGEATVRLLRRLGLRVTYPAGQTCCGQPLFNNGFQAEAAGIARRTIALLEPAECVVVPSGSCACMLKKECIDDKEYFGIVPLVEDLLSPHLDVLALEKGFRPIGC